MTAMSNTRYVHMASHDSHTSNTRYVPTASHGSRMSHAVQQVHPLVRSIK